MASFATLQPFLIWLLCVGIAAVAIGLYIHSLSKEGFNSKIPISITACPASTETYITSSGDTNCCDGDIVDKQCNGNTICSLSPMPPNGMKSCSDWVQNEWAVRGDRFCTPLIPYYFGTMRRRQKDKEGCSASPCTADGGSPQDTTKPTCKIYNSSNDEYGKADSCFNIRYRDNMISPSMNATKNIVEMSIASNGVRYPALLTATFIPTKGTTVTPVTCYDWSRFKLYLDAVDPTGAQTKSWEANKDTNVYFCGPARAYYVDATLSSQDAVGVAGPNGSGSSMSCATTGSVPYDTTVTYKVGDVVMFGGSKYKMVEESGGAGYPPDRPGDKLWKKQ